MVCGSGGVRGFEKHLNKIKYKDAELFADLSAEKPIAAEQNGRKIVVEIKSFLSPSPMRDFEIA